MAQARPTPDDIGKATVFAHTRRKATAATKSWVVVTEESSSWWGICGDAGGLREARSKDDMKASIIELLDLTTNSSMAIGNPSLLGCKWVYILFPLDRYRSQNHSDETVKQPHKLERKWSFWFDNQSRQTQGAAWGASLRQIYTFDTVEEFWCLYDQIFKPIKLPGNAEIHLFRAGVEPKWEDPECANGGKWSIPSYVALMMALIGEQFEDADEICGVVATVRSKGDKLSLWTKNAANEAVQMSIGRKWKEIIDANEKISYTSHDDSKSRGSKSRYSV
ncbi:hypothetical protein QQ045_003433 [Rhodiola kirilowii]